jgi:hypothetical protein
MKKSEVKNLVVVPLENFVYVVPAFEEELSSCTLLVEKPAI